MNTLVDTPIRSAPSEPEALSCQLLTRYDGSDHLREEWDQAAIELGGPVYMSYDWTRLWWQFYGAGRTLRVFLFRASGRIVAILPFYIDSLGLPGFRLRLARLLSASSPPRVVNPPVSPEWATEVWSSVLQQLLEKDRSDSISFGPIAETYAPIAAFREVSERQNSVVGSFQILSRDVRTLYELPPTYEAYFTALDSKERKVRRKKLRDLEAAHPLRAETVSQPGAVLDEFDSFVEQHTCQWQAEGRPGHFHAWPHALAFHRALVETMGAAGRVHFYKLWAGGQVATNQYTYAFGRTLFAELPARLHGAEWEKFSLGCTSQVKLIEAAIAEGFQRMDSGLGHYEYKILTGGKEAAVLALHLTRESPLSRLKAAYCGSLGRVLQVLLNKIWYRRITPRLPAGLRRSQSRLAIRYDF